MSLPADFLAVARKKAIGMFCDSLEIDGFRKGHVPENIVIEKMGEGKILEEAVDILLKEHFSKIIEENKLDIIGRPEISITKLALGNPVEFKAVFAVMPEFELPDYRAIAKSSVASAKLEKNDQEAGEEEIEDVLLQIRKNKAHFDWHEAHKEEKGHNHPEIKDGDLPILDDEFAKQAGNFKNLNELKEKVRENIINEKKFRDIEKRRARIMEELAKNTEMELPEILLEKNLEKSAAEKKAKIQLIFNKIAETEKLEPNKEILEQEVKEVMKHYPNASEQNARIYVATILLNSEVLKLLEK